MLNLNNVISNIDIRKQSLKKIFEDNNYKAFIINIKGLSEFYNSVKEKADVLTLEGEYVGCTYDNLEFIKPFIENTDKKLLKKYRNHL